MQLSSGFYPICTELQKRFLCLQEKSPAPQAVECFGGVGMLSRMPPFYGSIVVVCFSKTGTHTIL